MNHHDAISVPLAVISIFSPAWIHHLQDIWSIILPAGGAILLCLQIVYYWRMIFKQ